MLPTSETWYQDDNPPDLLWSGWSSLGEPESSRRFSQAGLQWVKTHPGDFLALVPKKIARLWGPASFSTQSDRRAGALTMLLWVPYLPFMALVVVGLVVSLGKWRHWFLMYALILSTNLVAAVFSGGTRYSMPMVPALLVFCALGLSAVLARLSGTSFEGARQEHSV